MRQIWAPWRIEYILSKKPGGCIFCDLPGEGRDRDNLILLRGDKSYVIMNRYPYTSGHVMVVPWKHASSLDGMDPSVLDSMMRMTRLCTDCLGVSMRPEGFNVGINIGTAGGAGIEEHLHIHIVPRWVGDSNFMAVMDEVRTIPEHLLATYDKLLPVFGRHAQRT